jgi:uncharacterized membrane protein
MSLPHPPPDQPHETVGPLLWIRNKLITGFIVLFPVVVTVFIFKLLYRFINDFCDPLVRAVVAAFGDNLPRWIPTVDVSVGNNTEQTIPGAGLVITLGIVIGVGFLASNFIGKRFVGWIENLMTRVPLVNTVYNLAKQVIDAFRGFGGAEGFANKQVVFVKYPQLNGFLIGFLTSRFSDAEGNKLAAVFIPTAPNPITGFVLVFSEEAIIPSGLAMDQAWKLIVTAGLIPPKSILPIVPVNLGAQFEAGPATAHR